MKDIVVLLVIFLSPQNYYKQAARALSCATVDVEEGIPRFSLKAAADRSEIRFVKELVKLFVKRLNKAEKWERYLLASLLHCVSVHAAWA